MAMYLRVKSIREGKAIMVDGRTVQLGKLKGVVSGDYLEVYANIAFAKVNAAEARDVVAARGKGGRYVS